MGEQVKTLGGSLLSAEGRWSQNYPVAVRVETSPGRVHRHLLARAEAVALARQLLEAAGCDRSETRLGALSPNERRLLEAAGEPVDQPPEPGLPRPGESWLTTDVRVNGSLDRPVVADVKVNTGSAFAFSFTVEEARRFGGQLVCAAQVAAHKAFERTHHYDAVKCKWAAVAKVNDATAAYVGPVPKWEPVLSDGARRWSSANPNPAPDNVSKREATLHIIDEMVEPGVSEAVEQTAAGKPVVDRTGLPSPEQLRAQIVAKTEEVVRQLAEQVERRVLGVETDLKYGGFRDGTPELVVPPGAEQVKGGAVEVGPQGETRTYPDGTKVFTPASPAALSAWLREQPAVNEQPAPPLPADPPTRAETWRDRPPLL